MNELEIIKKQRDILFECLKTISKSSNTPEAIKTLCNNAAKKAKNILNEEFPDSLDSSLPTIIEDTSPLKVGDKVIYSKYAGTEVELDGEEYIIVKQSDILAIVEA